MQFQKQDLAQNTSFKIIQQLHHQTYQYQQTLPKQTIHKNIYDYTKERLSPWNQDKSKRPKLNIKKIQSQIYQGIEKINTHRIKQHNQIFDYANFSKFYKVKKQYHSIQKSPEIKQVKVVEKICDTRINKKRLSQNLRLNQVVKLPSAYNTTTIQLQKPKNNNKIIYEGRKIMKRIPGINKKHLVSKINYRQIQDILFKKPMQINRFEQFCKKLQQKNNIRNRNLSSLQNIQQKVKIINFPIKIQGNTLGVIKSGLNLNRNYMNKTFMLKNKIKQTIDNKYLDYQVFNQPERNHSQNSQFKDLKLNLKQKRISSQPLKL